jgi:phage-related protein
MELRFYESDAGRSQPLDYLRSLPEKDRAYVLADLGQLEIHGDRAPISKKPTKGHSPLWEVRTGRHRSFFVRMAERFWILHICKKQDQLRGIDAAATRMKQIIGRVK